MKKRKFKKFFASLFVVVLVFSLNCTVYAVEDTGDSQGSVSLTVDEELIGTYETVTAAVAALKEHGTYGSATITFDGEYTENVDASSLNNVTFDGQKSATLNGTLRVNGSNVVISGIHFRSVLDIAVGYYDNDTAINMSGGSNITVSGNTFDGYNYVSNYYADTKEVSFSGNEVSNCVFFLHTSDGGVNGLTITNNTITGAKDSICASLMGITTITELSGNVFTYAYFGLQNCNSISNFLNNNTYDHGYLVDDTVDYLDGLDPHDGSTTLMTVLPKDAYTAVWTSSDDTQQEAINQPTGQTGNTITFTGQGAAVGYHYNSISVDYLYYGNLIIEKTFEGDSVNTDDLAFTISGSNDYEKTVAYKDFTDGKYTVPVEAGEYTVAEVNRDIDGYTCTTTVNDADTTSGVVTIGSGDTKTVEFVNTYTRVVIPEVTTPENTDGSQASVSASTKAAKTGDENSMVLWITLSLMALVCITAMARKGVFLWGAADSHRKR